ncbi:MAG TPA: ClbS/DfsB family four-helix bundle protein [Ktedonosporobacter sp.]|nr:ClbS/DfsB family four-helix bundle protein [Ktedonosporobacter sp.]
MTEHAEKIRLLNEMQNGYATFEELLATLNAEQMTTSGVNGSWSVKDNLAHLSSWQRRLYAMLQGVKENRDLPDPTPNMSEDEINEMFYQRNKDRSLDEVQADFRSTFQQVLESVQSMSEDDLNRPVSWLNDRPIWPYIVGNTFGHYQEHSQIITDWLARTS